MSTRSLTDQLINGAALLGIHSSIGYAYGLVANLPAKQVALAWAIWEVADIAIQCFANAYVKHDDRLYFKLSVLPISDIVGLTVLSATGLVGSPLMVVALVVCTLMARGFQTLFATTCACCCPGPRFTMDHVTYLRLTNQGQKGVVVY